MNWTCPICGKKNEENWICECGFDESKNYEKYPTLTKIDKSFSSLPSRNVLLYKFTDVLRKIIDSEKSTEYFKIYVSTNNVKKIEHLLNLYTKMIDKKVTKDLDFQYSLLAYALEFGSVEIVKLLLDKRANPNDTNAKIWNIGEHKIIHSPLGLAIQTKNVEKIRLLLEYGADRNDANATRQKVKSNEYRYSALSVAIDSKKVEIVELLLKYGTNPNIDRFRQWNINGNWKESKVDFGKIKNVDIIALLLKYGASSDTIENMGWLQTRKLKKKLSFL